MAGKSTRQTRTPQERAQEAADLAARKHERTKARLNKVSDEYHALVREEAEQEAEAQFLANHPLLKADEESDDSIL